MGTSDPKVRFDIRRTPTEDAVLGLGVTDQMASNAEEGAVKYVTSSGGFVAVSNGTDWIALSSNSKRAFVSASKTTMSSEIPSNTYTVVNNWTVNEDLLDNMDNTNTFFTAPRTGVYTVTTAFSFEPFSVINAGSRIVIEYNTSRSDNPTLNTLGGCVKYYPIVSPMDNVTDPLNPTLVKNKLGINCTTSVFLNVGDKLEVGLFHDVSNVIQLNGNLTYNRVTIVER